MISSVFMFSPNVQAFDMVGSSLLIVVDKVDKSSLSTCLLVSESTCLRHLPWICNATCKCSCRSGGRTRQIDLRKRTAHPPDKVAIHGSECALSRCKDSAMSPDTRAAA